MPTDRAHLIAFFVAQGIVVLLGIGAYVYLRLAMPNPKLRAVQQSFDFGPAPAEPKPPQMKAPPMAGV